MGEARLMPGSDPQAEAQGRGEGEGMGKRKSEEGEILIPVQSKQQKTVQEWGSPLS
jgi:hypothetical protein